MTLLEVWIKTDAASALGWTLFHSLWQGAVVALLLGAALSVMRSARVRYAAACAAMLAMLLAFVITFAMVAPRQPAAASAVTAIVLDNAGRLATLGAGGAPAARGAAALVPWFSAIWFAGVLIIQVRSLTGWLAARRLTRRGVCVADSRWQAVLGRLKDRLRISGPVLLLESCLVEVPVVIGWLRPVILVPVGLLAGLPASQVETILLHELAHIQRFDYLVHLIQTWVEGLLFYHPAVWWVSGVIRAERENCCDDLVVTASGDALDYATALTALEQKRTLAGQTVLAATGGNLMNRIRRLLGKPQQPRPAHATVWVAGALTITCVLALAAWQLPAQPQPSSVPKTGARPQVAQVSVSPYTKWVDEDVAYIIDDRERATFGALRSDQEREQFIEQFWKRRDPTPGTIQNEYKEEHYRRIAYANQRFSSPKTAGWATDRGRIYIIYGPADEIESHPSGGAYMRPAPGGGGQTTTYPFEQWRYKWIQGVGRDVIVEFVDKDKSGDYRMTVDPRAKEIPPQAALRHDLVAVRPGLKSWQQVWTDFKLRTIKFHNEVFNRLHGR